MLDKDRKAQTHIADTSSSGIRSGSDPEVKRLEKKMAFTRFTLNQLRDMAIWTWADGHIFFVNDEVCRLLGYTRDELLSMSISDIDVNFPPDRLSKLVEERKRAGHIFIESQLKTKDGKILPVEISSNYFEFGDKGYMVSLLRDITERNRAEMALKDSESFLTDIFGSIQDGISVLDRDMNIIRVNPIMERWYGTGIIGKKCYQVYHGRQVPCERCPSIRAFREKTMQSEVLEDLRGWSEIYAFPLIRDRGEVTGIIEHVRDVSERKLSEEALRKSEERFRQLASSIGEIFFIFSLDWKNIIYVSPAYERVWGRSLDSIYRHPRSWLDAIVPEDRKIVLAILDKNARGEVADIEYKEFRITRPDGTLRWIYARSYPLRNEKGEIIGIAGIAEDITRRKQTELELESAKDQAELYLDLMGHDINNMNQVGIGFLELALNTLELDENGHTLISKSLGALEGSTRLIDNVRKLQKAKSGELLSEEIDIGQVLMDVKNNFTHVPGKDVTINYMPARGFTVMANELLYDVFSNLVGNSIKHSHEAPVIDIALNKAYENGHLFYKVAIEDNGPGIPDELKAKIFNRHLRGSTKAKGSGIGLYLVKTLIDCYRGRVWVEDRAEGDRSKGSRFAVMLPAVENGDHK
jgi:PAS domain S-box-containing protein